MAPKVPSRNAQATFMVLISFLTWREPGIQWRHETPCDRPGCDGRPRMHEDEQDQTPQTAGRPDMEYTSDAVVREDPAQAIALPAETPARDGNKVVVAGTGHRPSGGARLPHSSQK